MVKKKKKRRPINNKNKKDQNTDVKVSLNLQRLWKQCYNERSYMYTSFCVSVRTPKLLRSELLGQKHVYTCFCNSWQTIPNCSSFMIYSPTSNAGECHFFTPFPIQWVLKLLSFANLTGEILYFIYLFYEWNWVLFIYLSNLHFLWYETNMHFLYSY